MVGLMVYKAARFAGMTRLPQVSVPMEIGAKPAETATADPAEDPRGL